MQTTRIATSTNATTMTNNPLEYDNYDEGDKANHTKILSNAKEEEEKEKGKGKENHNTSTNTSPRASPTVNSENDPKVGNSLPLSKISNSAASSPATSDVVVVIDTSAQAVTTTSYVRPRTTRRGRNEARENSNQHVSFALSSSSPIAAAAVPVVADTTKISALPVRWTVACAQAIDRVYKRNHTNSFTPKTLLGLEGKEIMRDTKSVSRNQVQSIRSVLYDLEECGLLSRERFEFVLHKETWDEQLSAFLKLHTA